MAIMRKIKTVLRFEKPSSWWGALWREGLPLGNGMTGACVLGGAGKDTIMLTSASSFWQGNISVLPDISDKIKEVRKLIDGGKYRQAENIYKDALIAKNYRPQVSVPLPICDFKISMSLSKPAKDYMRVLNMENGEALVSYKDGNTKFERSMFVSRADDLFIMEITKSGNENINADLSFDMHDRDCNRTQNRIFSKLPEAMMTKYEPFFMYYSARKDNGTEFGAVARISFYGGTQEVNAGCLKIKGANKILVIIKVFAESQREKEWKDIKALLSLNKSGYDKMLKEHAALHTKLMNTCELDLNSNQRDLSVDDLLKSCNNQNASSALLEKLWYFGRYLFISSAREQGSIIVNPYGLWCGDYKAVSSCPNFNGETQNLYRFAYDNNLCNLLLPMFDYFEGVLSDLKKNAQRLFNCKGIFIPAKVTTGTGLLGSCDAKDIFNIAGACTIAAMFYDYYCYTGDKKFLKDRVMPFLKETANFFEDFLKTDIDGLYISYPSYSPEGCPDNLYEQETDSKICIAKNCELDFSALRQVLTNLIDGCIVTGLYKEEIEKWKTMLTKIPKPKISNSSALAFVNEYNTIDLTENFKTGYAFGLYGAYPALNINGMSESEIKKAYLNSAKRRVTEGISTLKGHTISYLANICSRLFDTDTALELINHHIKTCVTENLVTADNDWRSMGATDSDPWATYQINGNTSLNSAITSLFVFSSSEDIYILPSGQQFKNGSLNGVQTRCGCEVCLDWDFKKNKITFSLKAKKACKINVVLPDCCKKILKGSVNVLEFGRVIKNIELSGGKPVVFEIKT